MVQSMYELLNLKNYSRVNNKEMEVDQTFKGKNVNRSTETETVDAWNKEIERKEY